MDSQYNQSGSYTAIAGLAVLILSKFGLNTDIATILTIIGGIIALVGIIKQGIAHKNLAIQTGTYHQ